MLAKELEKNDESGFTLVELLVVILIIGILAAIAIPIFMNQRKSANDAAVESDVKNIATEVETMLVSDPNQTDIKVQGSGGTATIKFTDGETETVHLSDGVSVGDGDFSNPSGDDGYEIEGWHENGKQYTGAGADALKFNSAKGGLQND